jgi:arylsulfatase A-like enzyme
VSDHSSSNGQTNESQPVPPEDLVYYTPGTTFPGVIGRTFDRSTAAWPRPNWAREGAPNVLFIVLDDTGFGQLGCYGSPIATPNIDALAADGLRYTSMHTTALCSPTRSCILTGRNHHSNHLSCITEGSEGFPGSDGYMPFENGMLSEMLLQHGYNTYALGKWHLTPADQISAAGPYDRWPLGRGFERYYGFLGGDTHQYYPDLVSDNHQVEPPATPEEGYHLTTDLVEHAMGFVADSKQIAPNKPFFMYFCTGAMHAPHHVPQEWADKYKGAFDDGWDAYREKVFSRQKELGIMPQDAELSRHDPDVQVWDELDDDARRLYARFMEVFAGFLEHTDHQIGRLIDFLKAIGEYDNTLIMLISDNGASAEGGPNGMPNEFMFFNNVPSTVADGLKVIDEIGGPKQFNHYPWGWAWAGDTPFRRWKRETYRGGVSDPFIVAWPKRIADKGGIRHQFAHAVDMVPTVLEALEVEPPQQIRGITQSPIEGVSLANTFADADAAGKHLTQYFEMFGHRSLYHDGWRAVCPWPGTSFTEAGAGFGAEITVEQLLDLDAHGWELYHVAEDPAETNNVAEENRPRLVGMIGQWYAEAGKYNVLPIDSRGTQRFVDERPRIAGPREIYTYYPHTQGIPPVVAVNTLNRSHSITASVDIPEGGAEGVLIANGGNTAGFALFVQDGKLRYAHNYVGLEMFEAESADAIPPGEHELRFTFEATGAPDFATGKGSSGIGRLLVDGAEVGRVEMPYTVPLQFDFGGISIGADLASPVSPRYTPPYEFTGTLKSVIVDVRGELTEEPEQQLKVAMARQ